MKNYYFLLLALATGIVNSQNIYFPDNDFKTRLLQSSPSNALAKNLSGEFFAVDANNDDQIQITEAEQVSYLDVRNSSIVYLTGIQYFTQLRYLDVSITSGFFPNTLYSLDVTALSLLETLKCSGNEPLATLNITGLTNLKVLECANVPIGSLDVTSLTSLETLKCFGSELTTLNVANLLQLKTIDCKSNVLTALDVSTCVALQNLRCDNNIGLNSINVMALPELVYLSCANCGIDTLDLSGSSALQTLICSNNAIGNLSLSNVGNLVHLDSDHNQLSSLDLTGLSVLNFLDVSNNLLTELDLAGLTNLENLWCGNNQLSVFDIGMCHKLAMANANNNLLTYANVKNGINTTAMNFSGNPDLVFVCADDSEIAFLQSGCSTCLVNSYCSFTPGGEYFTVEGLANIDLDNTGCDSADPTYPGLNFSVSNGTDSGSFNFSETNHNIPLSPGTHTITPVLENLDYFAVSPASITVNFPEDVSPLPQNFCIVPNGIHPDVEIVLLPTEAARPGFDAHYKIIYNNKGNTVASGTIVLTYFEPQIDFQDAMPMQTSVASGSITWNYENLLPFETREIDVDLEINSPMDTPPVNAGDILNFSAEINPIAGDETPWDNTFGLKQTVVASMDPNDKTCLEGAVVSPEVIGEYVHYLIRFENTGTYYAENIVVKDMVDVTKFDVSTLIPISGSHSFFVRTTETNKVEFIFENINLPFEDSQNDGYIAFKIKTLQSLITGDTFSNSASIYFDYNFPIITNTALTTIQLLGTPDYNYDATLALSPNPATNMLSFSIAGNPDVRSIAIYNNLGQKIVDVPLSAESIDVSQIGSGSYFIKFNTADGVHAGRFIKL